MKAVENFLDKSLYDFVTFKLRPPSDNLGINLCQLQSFSGHTARLLWTYVPCVLLDPSHRGNDGTCTKKVRTFRAFPSTFGSDSVFSISSDLISTVSRWWKCFTITTEMLHVTCCITVFNWWKVVTQLFPFVTFCLIQIWFQPHLSQGSRNGENWQILLIFPTSFTRPVYPLLKPETLANFILPTSRNLPKESLSKGHFKFD